jgi:hypothetical protein
MEREREKSELSMVVKGFKRRRDLDIINGEIMSRILETVRDPWRKLQ